MKACRSRGGRWCGSTANQCCRVERFARPGVRR